MVGLDVESTASYVHVDTALYHVCGKKGKRSKLRLATGERHSTLSSSARTNTIFAPHTQCVTTNPTPQLPSTTHCQRVWATTIIHRLHAQGVHAGLFSFDPSHAPWGARPLAPQLHLYRPALPALPPTNYGLAAAHESGWLQRLLRCNVAVSQPSLHPRHRFCAL